MDPTPPNPNQNPAQQPQKTTPELSPMAAPISLEQTNLDAESNFQSTGAAPQETAPGGGEQANQNAGMSLPPVVAQPVTDDATQAPSNDNQTSVSAVAGSNPAAADDVDVVEKEWVDRARKIVEQTKDDPYRQEQEVEKLQIDYMKKRYGREIKPGDPTA